MKGLISKSKTLLNIIRFYKAVSHVVMNPTMGALFLIKHPDKDLFKVVLFRRNVTLKYEMYGLNPDDRLGGRNYKIIMDQIEWPFPESTFPNGICPTCYRSVPTGVIQ